MVVSESSAAFFSVLGDTVFLSAAFFGVLGDTIFLSAAFFGVLGDTVFLSVVLWPFLFYAWAMLALTSVFSLCAENFCFITTLPDVRWGGRKRILSSLCVGG